MSVATTQDSPGSRRVALSGVIMLGVLVADQLSKQLVKTHMTLGESIPLIPGWVHMTLVRNTGMAFGLLSGTDLPYKTWLVSGLAIVAMVAVAVYALRAPDHEAVTRFGLMFILGGAVGNIIDRVRLGYVVDFIDVFYKGAHWPAFNVADASICVGVGLLLLDSFRQNAVKRSATLEATTETSGGEP